MANIFVAAGKLITDVNQTVPLIRDTRVFETGLAYEISAARLRTLSSVSVQSAIGIQVVVGASDVRILEGPWVLDPGNGLSVFGETDMLQPIAVSYVFRERALPQLERRG